MYSLLVDLNNLWMRNSFHKEVMITSQYPEYTLIKYFVFDQIYWAIHNMKKNGYEVDEVILAADSKDSWRKVYFPRYKESRAKKRKDDVDWETLFNHYRILQKDIRHGIPFKSLAISRCEGDDIIGVLCLHRPEKNYIIISTDSDFKQLLDRDNVKVYNPTTKEFLTSDNVQEFKNSLYLKGQSKDDIFNVKTPNDYPVGLRKPPLGDKNVEKILKEGLESFLDKKIKINKKYSDVDGQEKVYKSEFYPRKLYERNQVLIDFNKIPKVLIDAVLKEYDEYVLPDSDRIYTFFNKQGWKSYLDEFEATENTLLKLY